MTENWQRYLQYSDSDLPIMSSHTFYAPALSSDAVVLDLGGSTAAFANAVAHLYGCRCHVAEATSRNIANIVETELISKYHCAICGEDGPIRLWIAEDDFHWGSVQPTGDFEYNESETVPGMTFTSFLKTTGVEAPDLVKLDIEGAEFAVFETTSDQILQNVGQFTVEFHDFMSPDWAGRVEPIKERMSDLGFEVFSYSRRFHGDVLFLNRQVAPITGWQRFDMGVRLKNYRGLRRMLNHYLGSI